MKTAKNTKPAWVSSGDGKPGHAAPPWIKTLLTRARTPCGVVIPTGWASHRAMTVAQARKFFKVGGVCPRCAKAVSEGRV